MNVKEIQKDITNTIHNKDIHQLDGKYDIKLLLDTDNFKNLTDCLIYVFGEYKPVWNIGMKVMKYIQPENKILQPEPLSLAVYGSSNSFDEIRHVGIVSQNLTIISKWGLCPVFEHPPEHVPVAYERQIEYFRVDINKIYGICHPSLREFLEERK